MPAPRPRARLGATLVVLLFLMTALMAFAPPARGSTVIPITASNGSTVCPGSLGGTWSGATCSITVPGTYTIPSGTTVDIGPGVTVNVASTNAVNEPAVSNSGAINNLGNFEASNAYNGGMGIDNSGTIVNQGSLTALGANTGSLGQDGIDNSGTIDNQGTITSQGGGGAAVGDGVDVYNLPAGTINNDGTVKNLATVNDNANYGTVNDYCGFAVPGLSGTGTLNTISCYTINFDQTGIPATGVTWGVAASWGPFVLPKDHTGTGASIAVSVHGSLSYSYDTPVKGSGLTYQCIARCSGAHTIVSAATFSAKYQVLRPPSCADPGAGYYGKVPICLGEIILSPSGMAASAGTTDGTANGYIGGSGHPACGNSCSFTVFNFNVALYDRAGDEIAGPELGGAWVALPTLKFTSSPASAVFGECYFVSGNDGPVCTVVVEYPFTGTATFQVSVSGVTSNTVSVTVSGAYPPCASAGNCLP